MSSNRAFDSLFCPIGLEKQACFLKAVSERSTPCAVVGTDLTGKILSWNEGATRLYGYESREVIGTMATLLDHPEEVACGRSAALLERTLAAGKWEGRVRRVRRDGRCFPAQVTVLLRRDPAGKPCGLTVVSRDLTESEQIDLELALAQANGHELLDSGLHCLLMTDAKGIVRRVNDLCCRVLGLSAEQLIGTSLSLHFQDPARVEDLVRQVLMHEEVTGFELMLIDVQGAARPVRTDGMAVPGAQSSARATLIAIRSPARDGQVRAGTSAPVSQPPESIAPSPLSTAPARDARASGVFRNDSAAMLELIHELRTPLNSIIGFAELLHDGKAGPIALAHREYLADILSSARHMQRLLNPGAPLAKAGAIGAPAPPKPVELIEIVAQVRDGLRLLAAKKRLEVTTQIETGLPLAEEASTAIRQVLYNYLSNALKFTPEDGRIAIRCGSDGDKLRIDVQDSGLGIKPEDVERLFRPFEQLELGNDLQKQGSGLGLAITKRLAESLGGRVALESKPGSGSTFSVVLPLAAALAARAPAPQRRSESPESSTRLVAAPDVKEGDERTLCA